MLTSPSMHTLHVLASFSLRFSSSCSAASSAVLPTSGPSVIVAHDAAEVATLVVVVDILPSETQTLTHVI